jgi:hypothetical protein
MAQYEHLPLYKKRWTFPTRFIDNLTFTSLEYTTMRNLYLILVLATSLLPFATAQAAPANLPETGQAICYNTAGAVIACASTGQDGDLKAGVAWPVPRFVVGTGATAACVTDNLTGLMWMGAPDSITSTWANALTSANNLTLCGFSDWRLPNVNELESLVNSEVANQATFLNAQGFNSVQANYYWSSSSYAGSPAGAWIVVMSDGSVGVGTKASSLYVYVWPVRAGQ